MSFRVSALAAVVVALGAGSVSPAFGQPVAPMRPRGTSFSGIFTPGFQQQQFQQQMLLNQALNAGNPGVAGPGFVNPNFLNVPGAGLGYGALPGAYGPASGIPVPGAVATFNNLGHWYARGTGSYGHWYPNGVANGRGVLGYGGGSFSGSAVGPVQSGSMLGNLGGTALGVGAVVNQFRR